MANDNNDRKKLYNALKSEYDNLGTWEEFDAKLNDEKKRRALYDAMSQDFDNAGTWDDFNRRLMPTPAEPAAEATGTTAAAAHPQQQAKYRSVYGKEQRDGIDLRYYTDAKGTKVYHPGDVTSWRNKMNPYSSQMAGRQQGGMFQSMPNYGAAIPTSPVRNEFDGLTANSVESWERDADARQRMVNAGVRKANSAQQNKDAVANAARNKELYERMGLNADQLDAERTLEGVDANGMPVSGSRNVITETTDEEGNKMYIDADGNSSYYKEELEAYQGQQIASKAEEIRQQRIAEQNDRNRIAAEFNEKMADYERQIKAFNASDATQVVTPEASLYVPMTANADTQQKINEVIAARSSYRQMMAEKYPDIITLDTWKGVKNAVMSVPKAAAQVASDAQIALGALVGSESLEAYGRQVRAGIDKYNEEHPLVYTGAANEIVEKVHEYGGMAAATLAAALAPEASIPLFGTKIAAAIGKIDMARMILEGAAAQGQDARDNGASDYVVAGAEMFNALAWGAASKVIGTPFSRGMMKKIGFEQANNISRMMEQMQKDPKMARLWQNMGDLLQRAARQLGYAETPTVQLYINNVMNGTIRSALDFATAQTLCTAMSMAYNEKVGLEDVGASALEGMMTGAMFGMFFGAAGSVRPLMEYRKREAANALVEKGADKPQWEAEDEVTLLQMKSGNVGRLVGVKEGTFVVRMANGASVEVRPEYIYSPHTFKKAEFMREIDKAISEGVKSEREVGEGITSAFDQAQTHIAWQDVQQRMAGAGFSREELQALNNRSTRPFDYSDEHYDLAIEYLSTRNRWEGMMNKSRADVENDQRVWRENVSRRVYRDGSWTGDEIPENAVIIEATIADSAEGTDSEPHRVEVRSGDLSDVSGVVTIYDPATESMTQVERSLLSDLTESKYSDVLAQGYQTFLASEEQRIKGFVDEHLKDDAEPFPIMYEGAQRMAQYMGERRVGGETGNGQTFVALKIEGRNEPVLFAKEDVQNSYYEAALEGIRYANTKSLEAFDRGSVRAEFYIDPNGELAELAEDEATATDPVEAALTEGSGAPETSGQNTIPGVDAVDDGMLYHAGDEFTSKVNGSDVKVTVQDIDMVNGKVSFVFEVDGKAFPSRTTSIDDFNRVFSKDAMDAKERARAEAQQAEAERRNQAAAEASIEPAIDEVAEEPEEEAQVAPEREEIPVVTDSKGRQRKQYHLVSVERTLEDIAETDGYAGRGDAQKEFVEQKQKLAAKALSDHKSNEPKRSNYEDPEDYADAHAKWKAMGDEIATRKKYWDKVAEEQQKQVTESSRVTHGTLGTAIRNAEENPSIENKNAVEATRKALRVQLEQLSDDGLNDRARNIAEVADQMEREGRDTRGQDEYINMAREIAELRGMDMDQYDANIKAESSIADRKKAEEVFKNTLTPGSTTQDSIDAATALKMQMEMKGTNIATARLLIDTIAEQRNMQKPDWAAVDTLLEQQRAEADAARKAEEARKKAEAEQRAAMRRDEMDAYGEPQDAYEFVAMNLPPIDPEDFRKQTGYSGNDQRKYGVGMFARPENGGVGIERAAEMLTGMDDADSWLPMDKSADQYDTLAIRDMILEVLSDGNPKTAIRKRRETAMKDEMAYNFNDAYAEAMEDDLSSVQIQYKKGLKAYNDKVATKRSYANSREGMAENATLEGMKKAIEQRGGLLPTDAMVRGKKQKADYSKMSEMELLAEKRRLREEMNRKMLYVPGYIRTKAAQEAQNAIEAISQEVEKRAANSDVPFSARKDAAMQRERERYEDSRTEEEKTMTREQIESRGQELRVKADAAFDTYEEARRLGRPAGEIEQLRRDYGRANWESTAFNIRNGIYQIGLNANGHTAVLPEREFKFWDDFGKKMGAPVVMVDTIGNGGANGMYLDGIVWVAADAQRREGDPDVMNRETMRFTVGHEITHHLEKANPEAYAAYLQHVKEQLGARFEAAAAREMMNAVSLKTAMYRMANPGASYTEAADYAVESVDKNYVENEVAANYAGRMFENGLAERYVEGERPTAEDIEAAADDAKKDLAKEWLTVAAGKAAEAVKEPAAVDVAPFSVRKKPEPEKKGIGYKVFYMKDGKLYPPMVANPGGEDTPVGVWLDADAAPIVGTSKTGRPQVKNGGKGTQGGSGRLAYRPGWHLGEIPYALQFNRKDENGNRTLFPKDFVWAEVEYAADKDYQREAEAEGMTANGKFNHALAGLKRLPEDGFYRYRTNPNPETDPWIITGAMKVSRVLDKSEVDELVRAAGREPQKVEGEEASANAQGTVAEAIATAEAETNTNPTEAQKKAGNYKMGHVNVDGYNISIENPKGSTRSGKDADGNEWSVTMNNTYGYIRGTEGVDGDHIDVFLSDDPSTGNVYVIDQVNADGTFDEHKVMYGFNSAEEARENYLGNYSEGWQGLGTITEVSKEEFKKWVESSHRKTKPFAEYKSVRKAGYSIRQAEPVTDEKIAEYDAENNTEMRRFINYLNGERRLSEGENGFFHVGNTGDLLQRYGIEGRITIGTKSVNPNRHTNNANHGLTADEWYAAIEAINTPLAISKYTKNGADNQFRIYTEIKSGDKIICLGANVNQVGRDVRLTNIRTGYKRNLNSALDGTYEELLYPTRQELTRMIEQSSYQPNSDIYAESNASNVSERKVTENIRNEQENGAKSAENVRFSIRPQQSKDGKTLYGAHNISEEKLRKALKIGGLANPSTAVADIDVQPHTAYGEISLLMPSTLVEAKSGKNVGTYDRDAWTPLYPRVEYHSTKESRKNQENLLKVVENDELRRSIDIQMDYFKDGNSHQSGLAYVFLKQMGIDTPIEHNEPKYGETLADIERIFGDAKMNYDEYLDLPREQRDEVTARILGLRTGRDVQRYFDIRDGKGEATPKMREFMQRMFDEGVDYRTFESGISMLLRDRREAGTINIDKTIGASYEYIRAAGMAPQFKAWEAMTYGNMGYDEKFQVGFKPDGTRIYKKNTLSNVSAYMKKQGRNASGDHFSVGAGMLLAQIANRYRTLEQMRQQKSRLAPYGEGDGSFTKNGVSERLYNAARFFQSDKLPVEQYDQAWGFLEDAIVKGMDYDQLEKEFDEYFKYYDAHLHLTAEQRAELDQLREDCKNIRPHYFETKFERPVGIEEFASAVVPATTSMDVKAALRNKGLDVVEYDDSVQGAYDAAIRTATEKDGIRFSTRVRVNDPFYSNAAKAVEAVKQEKATADQWLAMIQKNGGLKAEEDKWMGLSEWLRAEKAKAAVGSRDKAITKQEVQDFILQNSVKVEEELYTETSDAFEALKEEYNNILRSEGYDAAWDNLVDKYGDDARIAFDDLGGELVIDNAEASSAVLGTYKQIDSTRIDYTTEGLDNKREVALIVPTIEPYKQTDETHFGDAGDGRAVAWIRFGETKAPRAITEEEYAATAARVPEIDAWEKKDGSQFVNKTDLYYPPKEVSGLGMFIVDYSSKGKWTLSDRGNTVGVFDSAAEAVAAYRQKYAEKMTKATNDRVLVIDEIQSKRHQDGREKGYKPTNEVDPAEATRQFNEFYFSMKEKYGDKKFAEWSRADQEKYRELDRARSGMMRLNANAMVPDAPFRKNWHELAMKRMLRLAAEEGYDKVAWTKGQQQAERYGLANVVRDIEKVENEMMYDESEGGRGLVINFSNGSPSWEMVVGEDGIISEILYAPEEVKEGMRLSDVIGKEYAESWLRAEDDTTVTPQEAMMLGGGDGMSGFYDKMLPQFMQKYGKKWGVKVDEVTLPDVEAAGRTMWSIDVTPEMKESVMQGQPLFSARRINVDAAHRYMLEPEGDAGKALADYRSKNKFEKQPIFLRDEENIDYICSLLDLSDDSPLTIDDYREGLKEILTDDIVAAYDGNADVVWVATSNIEGLRENDARRIIEHENIHAIDSKFANDPSYRDKRNDVLLLVKEDPEFEELKKGIEENYDYTEWANEAIAYAFNIIDKKLGPDVDYHELLKDHPDAADLLTEYRNILRNGTETTDPESRGRRDDVRSARVDAQTREGRTSVQRNVQPSEGTPSAESQVTYSARRRFVPVGERKEGNSEWEKATRHLYTELERIEDIRDDQRDTMPRAGRTPEEVEPNDIHNMSNFELRNRLSRIYYEDGNESDIPEWIGRAGRDALVRWAELDDRYYDIEEDYKAERITEKEHNDALDELNRDYIKFWEDMEKRYANNFNESGHDNFFRDLTMPKYYDTEGEDEAFWNGSEDASFVYREIQKPGLTAEEKGDIIRDYLEDDFYKKSGWEEAMFGDEDVTYSPEEAEKLRAAYNDGVHERVKSMLRIPGMQPKDVGLTQKECDALNIDMEGREMEPDKTFYQWSDGIEDATVHSTLSSAKKKVWSLHEAAKKGDVKSAYDYVKALRKPEKALSLVEQHPNAIVVPVISDEVTSVNMLPMAYAWYLNDLGLQYTDEIVRVNSPKHTGATKIERFFRRARFSGEVIPGQEYIIVDDHITMGGSVRDLKDYIQSKGGKVVAVSALTSSPGGTKLQMSDAHREYFEKLEAAQSKSSENKNINEELQEIGIAENWRALTDAEAAQVIRLLANARGGERLKDVCERKLRTTGYDAFAGAGRQSRSRQKAVQNRRGYRRVADTISNLSDLEEEAAYGSHYGSVTMNNYGYLLSDLMDRARDLTHLGIDKVEWDTQYEGQQENVRKAAEWIEAQLDLIAEAGTQAVRKRVDEAKARLRSQTEYMSDIFSDAPHDSLMRDNSSLYAAVGGYKNLAQLAHGVNEGGRRAIDKAAALMADLIPENAVLVPMPGHKGAAEETIKLAQAIAKITGNEVADVLEGNRRETQYDYKKRTGESLTVEDLGIRLKEGVDADGLTADGKRIVYIDNVVATGTTAEAARKAIGGRGMTIALADDRVKGRLEGTENILATTFGKHKFTEVEREERRQRRLEQKQRGFVTLDEMAEDRQQDAIDTAYTLNESGKSNAKVEVTPGMTPEEVTTGWLHKTLDTRSMRDIMGDYYDRYEEEVGSVFKKGITMIRDNSEKADFIRLNDGDLDKRIENNPKWWSYIKRTIAENLERAGVPIHFRLTDAEAKYMLWKTYADTSSPIGAARDIAFRKKLGIGEFASPEQRETRRYEYEYRSLAEQRAEEDRRIEELIKNGPLSELIPFNYSDFSYIPQEGMEAEFHSHFNENAANIPSDAEYRDMTHFDKRENVEEFVQNLRDGKKAMRAGEEIVLNENNVAGFIYTASGIYAKRNDTSKRAPNQFTREEMVARIDQLKEYRHILDMAKKRSTTAASVALDDAMLNVDYAIDYYRTVIKNPEKVYKTTTDIDGAEWTREIMERPKYSARDRHPFDDIPSFGEPAPPRLQPGESILSPEYQERMRDYEEAMRAYEERSVSNKDIRLYDADLVEAAYTGDTGKIDDAKAKEEWFLQQLADSVDKNVKVSQRQMRRAIRDSIIQRRKYIEVENFNDALMVQDIISRTTKEEREAIPHLLEGNWVKTVPERIRPVVDDINNRLDAQERKILSKYLLNLRFAGHELSDEARSILEEVHTKYPDYRDRDLIGKAIRDLPIEITPELEGVLNDIRTWFDSVFDTMQEEGLFTEDEKQHHLENYVTHIWDKQKSDPKAVAMMDNYTRLSSPYAKHRLISTLEEGLDLGLKMKYTDIGDIMMEYGHYANEAIANKRMLRDLEGYEVTWTDTAEDGTEVEHTQKMLVPINAYDPFDQYVVIDNNALRQYKVWKPLESMMNVVYGPTRTKGVGETAHKIGKVFDTVGGVQKKINLSLSFFHHAALSETAVGVLGAHGFMKTLFKNIIWDAAVNRHEIWKSIEDVDAKALWEAIKNGHAPAFNDAELTKDAVEHLVQLGATQDYAAKDVRGLTANFKRLIAEHTNDSKWNPLYDAAAIADFVNKGMDTVLWDYLHDGLKIYSYKKLAAEVRNKAAKQGWDAVKTDKALDEAGQFINDTFGGQHWDVLGYSPQTVKWMRRLLLSPDWTLSTLRQALSPLGVGQLYEDRTFWERMSGKMPEDARDVFTEREIEDIKDWKSLRKRFGTSFWVTAMLTFMSLYNGLNAWNRYQDEQEELEKAKERRANGEPDYKSPYELAYPDGMKWYDYTMFGNTQGKQTVLFTGRMSDGRERYARWGKQFRELPELFYGRDGLSIPFAFAEKMAGKLNPVWNTAMNVAFGRGITGWENDIMKDKEGWERTWAATQVLVASFLPYSIPTEEDVEFVWTDLFMPSTKGYTAYKAKRNFTTAILSGDEDLVKEVYKACTMNNLNADELLKTAIQEVQTTARKQMIAGVENLADAQRLYDESDDVEQKRRLAKYIHQQILRHNFNAVERDELVQKAIDFNESPATSKEKGDEQYIIASTFADIAEDDRLSNMKQNLKKFNDQYKELKEANYGESQNYYKQHKREIEKYKAVENAQKKIRRIKKQMFSAGPTDELMQQIRDIRAEVLKTDTNK